jgi:hypothetical protein
LAKHGQIVAGYNVQIAVDDKHKLIVASEVVNDGNDTGQLHAMAEAAKAALGVEALTAVADAGYFNGEELRPMHGQKRQASGKMADPLCQPSLGLPGVSSARALPGRQGRAARDRTLDG